ncbi:hypothetical protein [Maritimibacter dapengensis]|uniref:Peptidase propeptide and YPEB domain-containing protein n=1 Tax=Maritimibacter dapengensis TaxID=2836868 RepID=A0ABS6T7U8_9RHOB|nr:hypothetical protein [Maritimibacter dapengensis]MBV7380387.1 hypothetical protein [Maritimibacter dapengensis]
MYRSLIVWIVATCATLPAVAACEDEIRAMYDIGGLFDPAELSPQEHRVVWIAPDGTETPANIARWENANRVVSENGGMFLLSYDGGYFQGPGWDGPWQDMGYPASGDAIEIGRAMNDVVRTNLADMACDGEVEIDGRVARKYSYRYRVETAGGASWWESDYVLFVDTETGNRLRTEERGLIESWAETATPKAETRVTTITQHPGYVVPNAPDAD